MPQIVLRSAADNDFLTVSLPAVLWNFNPLSSGKICAGNGLRTAYYILHRAGAYHSSAVNSRSGAYIHNMVGSEHGIGVVFNHYNRVTEVAQALQRGNKLFVIPLMKPYARFIENIENSHKRRAYLRGKAYSLRLAAGEGRCSSGKSQIFKTHIFQKAQARLDLFQNQVGNHPLSFGELHILHKIQRLLYGHF